MAAPWHQPGEQPRIWARDDLVARAQLVNVPELGGVDIEVRSMTFGQRLNYYDIVLTADDDGEITTDWEHYYPALLIPTCWAPARWRRGGGWAPGRSTTRLWRWDDWDAVNGLRADALARLGDTAMRLSGMHPDEQKHAYFRLINDGEFRLAFDLADAWHASVEEVGRRLPAYEATWLRAYWTIRNDELKKQSSSAGKGGGKWESFGGEGQASDR